LPAPLSNVLQQSVEVSVSNEGRENEELRKKNYLYSNASNSSFLFPIFSSYDHAT
jgi:hypothetical protein